jgi:hypothetical protein
VFFLKVDGFKSNHARWEEGIVSPLNFTWLRASLTPPSCFESVGVVELSAEDQALALRPQATVNRKVPFFSKREEDGEANEESAAGQRRIIEAKQQAAAKLKMSTSVDAWVLCPFRSEHEISFNPINTSTSNFNPANPSLYR